MLEVQAQLASTRIFGQMAARGIGTNDDQNRNSSVNTDTLLGFYSGPRGGIIRRANLEREDSVTLASGCTARREDILAGIETRRRRSFYDAARRNLSRASRAAIPSGWRQRHTATGTPWAAKRQRAAITRSVLQHQ